MKNSMTNELAHFGITGMKWGVRRYQNPDGTLTEAGKLRYKEYTDSSGKKRYTSNDTKLGKKIKTIGNIALRAATITAMAAVGARYAPQLAQSIPLWYKTSKYMRIGNKAGDILDGVSKLSTKKQIKILQKFNNTQEDYEKFLKGDYLRKMADISKKGEKFYNKAMKVASPLLIGGLAITGLGSIANTAERKKVEKTLKDPNVSKERKDQIRKQYGLK